MHTVGIVFKDAQKTTCFKVFVGTTVAELYSLPCSKATRMPLNTIQISISVCLPPWLLESRPCALLLLTVVPGVQHTVGTQCNSLKINLNLWLAVSVWVKTCVTKSFILLGVSHLLFSLFARGCVWLRSHQIQVNHYYHGFPKYCWALRQNESEQS